MYHNANSPTHCVYELSACMATQIVQHIVEMSLAASGLDPDAAGHARAIGRPDGRDARVSSGAAFRFTNRLGQRFDVTNRAMQPSCVRVILVLATWVLFLVLPQTA